MFTATEFTSIMPQFTGKCGKGICAGIDVVDFECAQIALAFAQPSFTELALAVDCVQVQQAVAYFA